MEDKLRKGILTDILRANKAEVTDMLLKEYDEAFHISSEKDISFKEGQESERRNTEREKQRADAAERQVNAVLQQFNAEKQRADLLIFQNIILTHKLQGKNDEEIAALTNRSVNEIKMVLASALSAKDESDEQS